MTACPANRSRLRWRVSEIQDLDLPRTTSVMPFPHGPYVEATADPYKVKISTPINSAKKAATNLKLATPLSVLCSRPGMLACSTRSMSPRFQAYLCGVFLHRVTVCAEAPSVLNPRHDTIDANERAQPEGAVGTRQAAGTSRMQVCTYRQCFR